VNSAGSKMQSRVEYRLFFPRVEAVEHGTAEERSLAWDLIGVG
jgi:hypothetical protein